MQAGGVSLLGDPLCGIGSKSLHGQRKPSVLDRIHEAVCPHHPAVRDSRTEQCYRHWAHLCVTARGQAGHGMGTRHSPRAGTPWTSGHPNHNNLHPCPESGTQGRSQPG